MSEAETGATGAAMDAAARYYRAMVAGDEAALRLLFDSRAQIMGHYEGAFQWLGLDAFIDEARSLVGQHGEEGFAVEGIRIDGDIASVAIRGRYAGLDFVDHLSMVEVNDRWVITAKSFHAVI